MTEKIPAISLFDITGPVMAGPSSSHTAGAVRIGLISRQILGERPANIKIYFYGSLANTYKGHMTDSGVVGGLMDMPVNDPQIRQALDIAENRNISVEIETEPDSDRNPNTIEIKLRGSSSSAHVTALTVGGGEILVQEIDGFTVELRGKKDVVLVTGKKNNVDAVLREVRTMEPYEKESISLQKSDILAAVFFSEALDPEILNRLHQDHPSVNFVPLCPLYSYRLQNPEPHFSSITEVLCECERLGLTLPEAALKYESVRSNLSKEKIFNTFEEIWKIMDSAIQKGITGDNDMVGKIMDGKDSFKMLKAKEQNRLVSGEILSNAIMRSIATMETNASMGTVVAAPTAGSCGVLPGAFSAVSEKYRYPTEKIIEGLVVASLFGVLVAMRAPISGALGGCQSEIGVASAMTAAGLAHMAGGTPEEVSQAFALSLKSLLGLICDPVAGPVEVPCIKRNAVGVANAFAACDMALSSIISIIPSDDVIDALINVQGLLPTELRGTTLGGLGSTKTAVRLKEEWLSKCKNKGCNGCHQ
jgi:L-serine dehydratase